MEKNLLQSKRFWAGVLSLLTGVSLILTGEKTYQTVVPELVLTGIGLIQTIIAVMSGTDITMGGRSLRKL